MTISLAFDIYGTLIDTHGVVSQLEKLVGEDAPVFSQSWRNKQLEYSFRRGLMGRYDNFAVCTRDSLLYCCKQYGYAWSDEEINQLLDIYKVLPAFSDVKPTLDQLNTGNISCYAFSNGSRQAVKQLIEHAQIDHLFEAVISVDDVQTFKPSPQVYQHFIESTASQTENTWLISSNPFDIIGAIHAGWHTAWLCRDSRNIFDPWGMEPSITISNLGELTNHMMK